MGDAPPYLRMDCTGSYLLRQTVCHVHRDAITAEICSDPFSGDGDPIWISHGDSVPKSGADDLFSWEFTAEDSRENEIESKLILRERMERSDR